MVQRMRPRAAVPGLWELVAETMMITTNQMDDQVDGTIVRVVSGHDDHAVHQLSSPF